MNRKIAPRSPSQNNPPESRIPERESSSSISLAFLPANSTAQPCLPQPCLPQPYPQTTHVTLLSPISYNNIKCENKQYTSTTYRNNPPVASVTHFKDTTTNGWRACCLGVSSLTSGVSSSHRVYQTSRPPCPSSHASVTHLQIMTHSHSFTCQKSTHVSVG
jgi:hypothetical protein